MLSNLWNYLVENQEGIELALKVGTFLVSVCTLFGALLGGLHSVREITRNHKSRKLTEFITLFSDENEIKRLSGINGLSLHARSLFRELFFICSIEENAMIRELIYDALLKRSVKAKSECIWLNDFVVGYFLQQEGQGRLLAGVKNETEMISKLKRSQTERRVRYELKKKNPPAAPKEQYAVDNHILLSSMLLAGALTRSFHIRLNGNLILQSNLYAARWIGSTVRHCAIVDNVARHMFSVFTGYDDCFLCNNNYLGSRFVKTTFHKCSIIDVGFRDCRMLHTEIAGGRINAVCFNQSSLYGCKLAQITEIRECTWNGCTIQKSRYEDTRLVANEMKGVRFSNVSFTDVNLWRSAVVGTFTDCTFSRVKWGGTVLKGVQFNGCVFQHTDFSGVKPVNCKFMDCRFMNTETAALRAFHVDFVNCQEVFGA